MCVLVCLYKQVNTLENSINTIWFSRILGVWSRAPFLFQKEKALGFKRKGICIRLSANENIGRCFGRVV